MSTTVTTLVSYGGDASGLARALADAGLVEPDATAPDATAPDATTLVTTTLLDSFDGRLHRAGLRAVHLAPSGGPGEFEVGGQDTVPVRVPMEGPARTAADLPAGPLRDRIAHLLDVRALLPVVQVGSRRRRFAQVDREGKTRVVVDIHDEIAVRKPTGGLVVADDAALVEVRGFSGYLHEEAAVRSTLDRSIAERSGRGRGPTTAIDGDVSIAVAAISGVDLRGVSGRPEAHLDRRQPAIDGFRAVLVDLAATIEANRPGTIDDLDPEFLHDLRVAVRRTRSILGHARDVLPADVRDRARTEFRQVGAATGPARDLDVQLLEWDELVAAFDPDTVVALEPVRELLGCRRAEAHVDLAKTLSGSWCTDLLVHWRAWLDQPDGHRDVQFVEGASDGAERVSDAEHAARPLGEVVAERIERAQRRLVRDGRSIDDASPTADLHELRKDAKKLRYLFECFAPILPGPPRKQVVKRLKRLQDLLGKHQDAEVHVHQLGEVASRLHSSGAGADTLLATGRLVELQDRRRAEARARFARTFADYDGDRTERALERVLAKLRR